MEPDSKAGRIVIGIAIVVILLLLAPYCGISPLGKDEVRGPRIRKPTVGNVQGDDVQNGTREEFLQESRKDGESANRSKTGKGQPSDSSAVLDDIEELLRDGKDQ